ncbi:DNA polymerase III subunit gamma/tau, partial [Agarivorans sp.]|uniref:DNA polymerase III subunit gamma/tau n=1 Tax=Agarivorans sp. TaxID=1872412 RepID=UPI003D092C0C
GTRGVGKTTIARLFAKSLNCEQGVSSQPCGQCSNCIEVDQGNFVDLLEIDAASRTKVEDTRELLDNVQYSPAKGRYKVYLIDEVHMLSRHSFNALLKTLEEPPEHVKFLLATTDPQKLPVTVLSRCLQFQLKALSEEQIAQQLARILDAEQRAYQPAALQALAHAADGSMRDALSLTDQALASSNNELEYQSVLNMLGVLDPHQLRQLVCHVVAGQSESAFNKISELASMAPDYEHLHQQLAEIIHQVAMAQVLPASQHDETIQMLAEQVDAQLIQLLYQIAITGKRDLAYAPSPRGGFEMTILRMLAFQPAERVNSSEPEVAQSSLDQAETLDASLVKEQQEIIEQAMQQGYHLAAESLAGSVTPAPAAKSSASQAPREAQREQNLNQLKNQLRANAAQPALTNKSSQHSVATPAPAQTVAAATEPDENTAAAVEPATHASAFDDDYYAQFSHMDASLDDEPNYAAEYAEQALNTGQIEAKLNASETTASSALATAPSEPDKQDNTASLLQLRSQLRRRGQGAKKPEEAQTSAAVPVRPMAKSAAPASSGPAKPYHAPVPTEQQTEPALSEAPAETAFSASSSDNDMRWAEMVQFMELGPIAKQIALNSLYRLSGRQVQLLLKSDYSHLPKDSSLNELRQQLSSCLQMDLELDLQVGEDNKGRTPSELAQLLHQKKMAEAIESLQADPNIQILQQRFSAELDHDSVKYH